LLALKTYRGIRIVSAGEALASVVR